MDKKYVIYIRQHGEGCDYTIGCGNKMITLSAKDINQANERFAMMCSPYFNDDEVYWTEDYGGYYDERALKSAIIFEVSDVLKVDVDTIYKMLEHRLEAEKQNEIEQKERAEFERLKNKFG